MFGAQRSHGTPSGQTWIPVSEPLVLNWVFDFPQEKPETGLVPPKLCPREAIRASKGRCKYLRRSRHTLADASGWYSLCALEHELL